MILESAQNRQVIIEYLEGLKENDFINNIIIPLFRSYGYIVYRIIDHGPGEHGKDIIFYRHVPLFFDNEYIVVQAKSEKVTASNIYKFCSQIARAFKTPFPRKSGNGNCFAN